MSLDFDEDHGIVGVEAKSGKPLPSVPLTKIYFPYCQRARSLAYAKL